MATYAEIPTEAGHPFFEIVTWDGVAYTLYFKWNTVMSVWVLDIYDEGGTNPIIDGLPMVTGTDIFSQFEHMPFAATTRMTVVSIGPGVSPDAIPTFNNFGTDGRVFLITP
jgi:hypothetical protein